MVPPPYHKPLPRDADLYHFLAGDFPLPDCLLVICYNITGSSIGTYVRFQAIIAMPMRYLPVRLIIIDIRLYIWPLDIFIAAD